MCTASGDSPKKCRRTPCVRCHYMAEDERCSEHDAAQGIAHEHAGAGRLMYIRPNPGQQAPQQVPQIEQQEQQRGEQVACRVHQQCGHTAAHECGAVHGHPEVCTDMRSCGIVRLFNWDTPDEKEALCQVHRRTKAANGGAHQQGAHAACGAGRAAALPGCALSRWTQ